MLIGLEFVPGEVGIDARFLAAFQEVALAVFAPFSLERFDGSFAERDQVVGDGFVEIDANDFSEAPAVVAGSEGRVERKKGGGGFYQGRPARREFF